MGKKVGLFLQKVLYTKNDNSDGYKFEVRHVFQPGTRKTYAEHAENAPAETIAALELSMKDKDERTHGGAQFSGPRNASTGGNPYANQPETTHRNHACSRTAVSRQWTLTTISRSRRSVFRSLLTLSMRYDARAARNRGWRGAPPLLKN